MTKKVFGSISQCCHAWAQQNQKEGRTSSGNVFFKGKTIYSYGYHFPIATFVKEESTGVIYVIYNNDRYSVIFPSTSNHQYEVRRAVTHYEIIPTNTALIEAIVTPPYDKKLFKAHLKRHAVKHLEGALKTASYNAAKRRKKSLIESDINEAVYTFDQTEKLLSIFKIKIPVALRRKLEALQTDTEEEIERMAKQLGLK